MQKLFFHLTAVALLGFLFICMPVVAYASDLAASPEEPDGSYVFFKPDKTVEVPVIMYHLITKNGALVGRYGITPEEMERDLRYLQDNGYETVVMEDLIAYVYRGRPLPPKPVMLTFDDGNASDYRYLYPLLQKYKSRAVLSILGKQADEYTTAAEKNPGARFPNLTWPQVKEMKDSGCVEIQSHGYEVHGAIGSAKRRNESPEAYKRRLSDDLGHLQARCKDELKIQPTTFAYPLGMISESSRETLNDLGFTASFSCCEGVQVLNLGDPECLFRIKRNIRPSGRPIERILERIKKTS